MGSQSSAGGMLALGRAQRHIPLAVGVRGVIEIDNNPADVRLNLTATTAEITSSSSETASNSLP
jgi:hypothetical protein